MPLDTLAAVGRVFGVYATLEGVLVVLTGPDRPHFPGVSGWEEVADYALEWATANATRPAT